MKCRKRERWRRTLAGALAFGLALGAASVTEAQCLTARPLFEAGRAGGTDLRQPSDIALQGEKLFVLDDLNGRVAVFDLGGKYLTSLLLPGGPGRSYLALAGGGADHLFLAASEQGKIVEINQSGRQVGEFDVGDKGESAEPTGIEVSRGNAFVVDNEGHRVRVFDLEGKLQWEWGGVGEGPQQFRYPFRVVQDTTGRIVVSDALNSRVQIFTPRGEFLASVGQFGVTEGTVFRPAGLAVWQESLIAISDNYLGSLQFFDFRGQYQGLLCTSEGRPMIFHNPVSLAARGPALYVLEMGAGKVSAFQIDR